MQSLPQISVLDGVNRLGSQSLPGLVSPCDIPGLEDYVDLLLSSDTSRNEAVILMPHFHYKPFHFTLIFHYNNYIYITR